MLAGSSLPLFPLWCCAVHSVLDLLFHVCNDVSLRTSRRELSLVFRRWRLSCVRLFCVIVAVFGGCASFMHAVTCRMMDQRLTTVHYSLIQRIRFKNELIELRVYQSSSSHCCTGCTWWPWMHHGFIISSRHRFPLPVSCLVFINIKLFSSVWKSKDPSWNVLIQ